MKEYGSDFHSIGTYQSNRTNLNNVFPGATYLADGRMCLLALIEQCGWKRIWMPEYFCYEVIETIRKQTGIEIIFYVDYPDGDDIAEINKIKFQNGDALFRINYFGMRAQRSEKKIPVPVIEDHTHDLLGHWALHSDADWCIASLRKTLPIPEGGIMWSPIGHKLAANFEDTEENELVAAKRWEAMEMKASYLAGEPVDKDAFRSLFLETEKWFDTAPISSIDKRTIKFINGLDINDWYNVKKDNLKALSVIVPNSIKAEDESSNLFSLILKTDKRQEVRRALIESHVYTAILWDVPDGVHPKVKKYSEQMMSVLCDGRYSVDDMTEIADRIKEVL